MKGFFLILGILGIILGALLLVKGNLWGAALLFAGVGLMGRPFGFSKRLKPDYDHRPDNVWEVMTRNKEENG